VAGVTFASTPAGATYAWTNNNTSVGLAASGSGNIGGYTAPVVAAQQIGTISVTPTLSGCAGTAGTFSITINPKPTLTAVTSQTVCSGSAVAGVTFASTPAGSTFAWTNNNTSIGLAASGSGNIGGYTAPVVAAQQVGTISVTPTLNGCAGTPGTFNITINPKPTLTAVTSQTVCSGSAVAGVTFASTPAGSTFAWTNNNTSIGLAASGSGNIGGYTAPVVAAQQVGTISVTPSLTGCAGTPGTFNITVNPTPVLTAVSSQTVCGGSPVAGATFASTPAGSTFAWTNSNASIGLVTSGSGNIAGYMAPNVASQQIGIITVTPTLTGCPGTAGSFSITVNPTPVYSLTANSYTICAGSSQALSVSGANTYTWTPSATLTGANTASPTATPATTTVYSVTGTSASGCSNATPATVTVTVNPKPTFSLSGNAYTICNGGSQTFTVSGASTYTWTPSATLTNPNTANPTASPTVTTVYSVTGTSASGCSNLTPATVTVTVSPIPALSLSSSTYTICNGSSQTFTVSGASSYTWTPAATLTGANTATPTASPTVTTVYTVNGVASGCAPSSPLTLTLTVNPKPTYSLTSSSYTICAGSSQGLSVSGASSYTWTPSATLTGANTATPTATPATTTVYSVTGTSASGCGNTTPATVTVTVNPKPTYSLAANSYTICNGGSQGLSVSGASTYTWTPAATLTGANTATPTAAPVTTTVYSVTGTSASGCGNTIPATVTVTVNPQPTYSLSASSYTICNGGSQTFTVGGASSYTWTPSVTLTGANTANPTANPSSTTVYSVTGTSAAGCSNLTPATVTLTVNPLPVITVVPSTTAICSGGGSSTLTASGASTYTWTPSATLSSSTGSVVTATPTNTATPTVYTVTGTDSHGCVNNNITSITVNQTPTVTVSGGGGNSQSVCGGGLTNTSVNGITFNVSPAGSINWTNNNTGIGLAVSGAGNIATYPAPTVTVQTVGMITATAIAAGSGCASTSSTQLVYTVTINPIPGVTTPTITPAGCGLSDGTIIGAAGTGGSTYQYSWNGGTTFGSSSSYTNAAGTYPLEIKDVTTGCIFSQNFTLPNAGAPPPPVVTASSTVACVGGMVVLTAPTVGGTTYNWTEANGNTGTGNSYTVTSVPGSPNPYTINVTSTAANCTGVAGTTSITVNPLPVPSISSISSGQVCSGSLITLTVTPNTGGYSYQWSNSSGNIAGATHDTLSVSAAGVYSVTVTNTVTSCSATTSANGTVTVNSLPLIDTAGVSITQSNCSSPTGGITNVTYTVNGTGIYVWTDNSTGVVVGNAPTLSNVPAGNYCVQVTDANSCIKKFCYVAVLDAGSPAQPVLTATLQDTVYCNGTGPQTLTVSVTNSGTVTPTVNWYSDPGLTNTLAANSTTYTPTGLSVGTTTLYVTATANGCQSIGKPVTITVLPTPAPPTLANGISNPFIECQGQTPGTLTVTPTNTLTTIPVWYSGGNYVTMGTTYTPSTTTAGTTVYSIIDSVMAVNGCSSASTGGFLTVTVTINPSPAPPVVSGTAPNPLVECQGYSPAGTLSVTPTGTITSVPVWYNGSTYVTTGNSYTPSTSTAGTTVYTIADSASVPNGCSSALTGGVITVTVTINPGPTAPVISGTAPNPLIECQGQMPGTTLQVTPTGTITSIPVWYKGTTFLTTGNSYTPPTGTAGTTIYTVVDSASVPNGCSGSLTGSVLSITVTINPAPTAPVLSGTASNPLVECQGITPAGTILVSPTGTVASVPVWYNGTTYVTTGNSYSPPTTTPGTTVYTISDSASVPNGCSSALTGGVITVTVTINQNPIINLSTATTATAQCGQATGGVNGITPADVSLGLSPYTYQWYNGTTPISGATTPTLTNQPNGVYTLIVTDANGCIATPATAGTSTTFTVPTSAALTAAFTTSPNPATGSVPLSVVFTNNSTAPVGSTYIWSFGDGSPDSTGLNTSHTYTAVGTYTASLVIQNGSCSSNTATATIIAEIPTTMIIPNIFSPNGDGINDEFFIINTGMTSLNCEIFSRWGQLLYTITAPNQSWDGNVPNGDKAPEGTYMYILQAQGLDGKTYKQQGTLMLVR
jgi:gliding motility-associated-like protein